MAAIEFAQDVKAVLQSEAAECGLACIAMVASHHGDNLGLLELRRRFAISLKGAQLSHLVAIGQAVGFATRALRLDLEDLGQLSMPCILHWDLNHFVVLAKVRGDRVTIHDPAIGKRTLSLAEVSERFTGVALELTPTAEFKPARAADRITLSQLTGRVSGLWRALALILMVSAALQVFALLAPFYMQWVVDHVLVAADKDLLTVLGLGFLLALLLQVAIGAVRGWAVVYLSSRLGLQWMGNVFAHLLRLPVEFFERRHLGDVTSRMGSVQTIQQTLTTSFVEAIIDGLMALVTLVVLLVYSWKLALVTVLAVALYFLIRTAAYRPMRDGTERQLIAAAKQQTHLLESIRGIQSLKLAGCEPGRRAAYANLMHDTVNRDVWLAKLNIGFASASQLVFGIERVAVIWLGATLALSNIFSVGMLVAYLAYKDQFAQRMSGLIDKLIEFRMLRLHGERLADIALAEPEPAVTPGTVLAPVLDRDAMARLEVTGLSYRYATNEPWVLRDCSFTVEEGESLAIVGPSGCGKTTLVKLMLGLLAPTDGRIHVNGFSLEQIGVQNYRVQVGAVMQDDQLFAGSIAENIAFGDDAHDLQRIQDAARLAAVHDEIAAMPMGYHSLIGDMGATLSGGQRQRVILARALYRKPRILFLDEATSHLDIERERAVNDAVRSLNVTRVIIAHRPETIASADRVLVLHGGRIVQEVRQNAAMRTSGGLLETTEEV